jgi:hypothetical protein
MLQRRLRGGSFKRNLRKADDEKRIIAMVEQEFVAKGTRSD